MTCPVCGAPVNDEGCVVEMGHDQYEPDEPDREPTPADEEGWDAREDWLRGSAL